MKSIDASDVICYLCKRHPYKKELSPYRLTLFLYLIDCHAFVKTGMKMTNIEWYYTPKGPSCELISDYLLPNNHLFTMSEAKYNPYTFSLISLIDENMGIDLEKEAVDIINHILELVKPLYWESLMKLVYFSTPMVNTENYGEIKF